MLLVLTVVVHHIIAPVNMEDVGVEIQWPLDDRGKRIDGEKPQGKTITVRPRAAARRAERIDPGEKAEDRKEHQVDPIGRDAIAAEERARRRVVSGKVTGPPASHIIWAPAVDAEYTVATADECQAPIPEALKAVKTDTWRATPAEIRAERAIVSAPEAQPTVKDEIPVAIQLAITRVTSGVKVGDRSREPANPIAFINIP